MNKLVKATMVMTAILIVSGLYMVNSAQANEWKQLRMKNDSFVYSIISPLDLDTLNITLRNKVNLPASYRYNVTICNLTTINTDNIKFNNIVGSWTNSCWNTLLNLRPNTLNRNYNLDITQLTGAFSLKFGNGTEETILSSDDPNEDVVVTLCGDNQTYFFNDSLEFGWMVEGTPNETAIKKGGWQESLFTYQSHPQCISWIPSYEVDMLCITQSCSKIVNLNQITGNITTIWQRGEIW